MKQRFFERIGQWITPPCIRKCLTSFKALTLLLVMGLSVNVWGETASLTLSSSAKFGTSSGSKLKQNNVEWIVTTTSGAIQNSYQSAYNGQQFGVKATPWKGTFSTSDISGTITKVAVNANTGGAAKLSVKVGTTDFTYGDSKEIDVKKNTSSANNYEFTGSASGQIVISLIGSSAACYFGGVVVTYSTASPTTPSLSVDPATIDFGEVYQNATVDAKDVTVTFANLTTNDVAAAISGSVFGINKTGSFTSGDKITITPSTTNLGEYEETLTLSATGVDDQTVIVKMNVVAAPVLETYNKVTSVDDLAEGDIIVLASGTTAYGVAPTDGHTYIDAMKFADSQSASLIGNVLTAADAYELTLAKSGDNWTMTSADGLVGTTAAKTMTFGNTTKATNTWSISIGDDANASITSTNSSYGTIKYNSSAPRFLNYASGQTAIQIYKKEVAAVYSKITLATCENGEVSVTGADDLTSVASGTEITLGNTPATGYTLDEYDVYKTGEPATKVTIEDGKFKMPAYGVTVSATFKVAKVLNSVEITTPASKTEYWVNEEFSTEGLVLTAHFASGDEVVTPTSITTPDMTTAGEKTIIVSFTEGATTKSDTYTITVKAIENTKETAYTVAEAIALIDANPTGLATAKVYVKGVVSTMISTYLPEGGGYLNYYVSKDGQTTSQEFEFYQNYKNSNLDKWTSLQDVQIGAQVIGYGTLTKYGETYEFNKNNYLVSYVAPENPKTTATITLSGYTTTLSTDDAADEVTIDYNGDGELSATSSNESAATAAIVNGKLVVTPGAAGSATITVSAPETDAYTAASKSYNLTVTAGLTPAALPFTFDGGKNDINPANGIKADGLANDYSASPKLKFDGEGDYVLVKIASKAAQVSYKIKGAPGSGDWAGQFDVLESADGTAYTTVASHTELGTSAETKTHDLLEGTRYIKFVFTTKENGNVALGAINIVATKPKVDPTFSIANVDVTVEDMAELQITTNSDGAVTYTIDPDNEGIEIENGVVYAYTEGTYTVTANKAETETYNAAETTFTVTVSTIEYKTVEVTTFTAIDGGLLELGQFHSYKGDAGTAPAVNNGQIRLYQIGKDKLSGGYITISALPGLKIAKIDITTAMATLYNYKVDAAEDYTLTEAASLDANATANIAGLTADSVRIYCLGTTSSSRFYVSYLKVYYTGELETVSALAVDGAEKTEYEIGEEVDHTGAVVTATFENAVDVDVTLNSTFTDPEDMTTPGTKQVTAEFAEQTATYDITVKAETPEITVDVTEVGFGTVLKDDVVDAKTVAVTLKAITNATVEVSGEGASAFSVTPTSLTESGNITITPVTTAAGEFTATITISADGAEDKTIALSMTVSDGDLDKETVDFTEVYSDVTGSSSADFEDYNGVTFNLAVAKNDGTQPKYYAKGSSVRAYAKNTITISSTKTIAFILINYTSAKGQDNEATVSAGNLIVNEKYGMWELNATTGTLTVGSTCSFDKITVYYKYDATIRTGLSAGQIGTICQANNILAVKGVVLYNVEFGTTQEITLKEITEFPIAAGTPAIFQAEAFDFEVIYGSQTATEAVVDGYDGLVGLLQGEVQGDRELIEEGNILVSGGKLRLVGANCYLTAGHAYIKMEEVSPVQPVTSAPGRRLVLTNAEAQVVTGLNAIQVSGKTRKMMINNQMVIIREGKMYNAQGTLMK